MANKHLNAKYNIFGYQGIQIKTFVGYHHTPPRIPKITKTNNTKCCKDMEQQEFTFCRWECK